jgi:hypothetical protein
MKPILVLMKTFPQLLLTALSLAFAISVGAQPPDVRQGLVSYWPLDVNNAGTTPDAAFGNTMTIVGAPTVGAGQFGNAFTFNGSSTYLTNLHTADNAVTGLPIYRAGSYTVAMWVKGAAQTAKFLYGAGNTNVGGSTAGQNPIFIIQTGQLAANNAKLDIIIRNDAGTALINHLFSTTVVFDNTWHHVAWVDDRGSVRLYVDGNLDAANFNYTPTGVFTFNTSTIGALFRANLAGVFNGQIDDVAMWERPLTQAEVQQVKNSSLTTPIPALPPYITTQPASALRFISDRVTLSVRAVGQRSLSYQWYKGGAVIEDATNSSLTLVNLTVPDSGNYTAVVTNLGGSVTSAVATLTVPVDPPTDVARRLVSWWPLDVINTDGVGPFTPDPYSQNDLRLTNMSAANLVAGRFGNAATFNGLTQFGARAGGFPIYNNPAFTVALWVNGTGIGQADRRFFSESSTLSPNPLFNLGTDVGGANGTIRVFIRNDSGALVFSNSSTRVALDGTWHHVVWTETNGQARLYIDGVLDESNFNYTRGPLTLNQTSLGAIQRTNIANYFSGALDDVAVWNRVLTIGEIQTISTTVIPTPVASIPPTITQDPASLSLFTRSKATFKFLATGSSPLAVQWRKGGNELVDETNQTLVLNNLMLSDAGGYDVVVTNLAGGATSQVATLTVTLRPPPPGVFGVDFNNIGSDDSPANTEVGFGSFSLPAVGVPGPFTRSFGGADVTVTGIGTALDSRKRATPVNGGAFTEERLMQDFVFAVHTTSPHGLDVALEFLEPNMPYRLGVWSFDSGSPNARVSDWTANGASVNSGYSFAGGTLPVDNSINRFNFDTTSDADGKILIQGRRNASGSTTAPNVFLNALKVEKRQLRIVGIEYPNSFDITLVIEVLDPVAQHYILEKNALDDAMWGDTPDVGFEGPVGNILKATFLRPAGLSRFYRVVEIP